MSSSKINMNNSDFFICKAFREMLIGVDTENKLQLDSETVVSLANYLAQIPPAEQLQPSVMANHITKFCQQPGNEQLNEWLGEIYDRLDEDGIDKLVKKTGDPGETADDSSQAKQILYNDSRDIFDFLQKRVSKNQNTPEKQNEQQPKS
jgi:hypothetical protein